MGDITSNTALEPAAHFSRRLRYFRERAGMTRAVLGGLVGRSESWVKSVETERFLMPRLPMLIRLADVLRLDLAELVGEQGVPAAAYSKGAHPALPKVTEALTD